VFEITNYSISLNLLCRQSGHGVGIGVPKKKLHQRSFSSYILNKLFLIHSHYIYSAEPHLTVGLVNLESHPGVLSRVIYITRFGDLLPGWFYRSAPVWSARSHFLRRRNCDFQTGIVLSLWLAPSNDRDEWKLIMWRVSGLITSSWEILMTN